MLRRDMIIVAAAVALATIYLYATFSLPAVEIGDPLGPKAYPAVLGVCLLIAAAMILLETRRTARRAAEPQTDAPPAPPLTSALPSPKVWGALLGTLVFVTLFEPLGYLLASALYLFGLMLVFHPGHLRTNAAVAVLFTLASYVLFQHLLSVSLPPGLLSF